MKKEYNTVECMYMTSNGGKTSDGHSHVWYCSLKKGQTSMSRREETYCWSGDLSCGARENRMCADYKTKLAFELPKDLFKL